MATSLKTQKGHPEVTLPWLCHIVGAYFRIVIFFVSVNDPATSL
jgi:hypothetical protein